MRDLPKSTDSHVSYQSLHHSINPPSSNFLAFVSRRVGHERRSIFTRIHQTSFRYVRWDDVFVRYVRETFCYITAFITLFKLNNASCWYRCKDARFDSWPSKNFGGGSLYNPKSHNRIPSTNHKTHLVSTFKNPEKNHSQGEWESERERHFLRERVLNFDNIFRNSFFVSEFEYWRCLT